LLYLSNFIFEHTRKTYCILTESLREFTSKQKINYYDYYYDYNYHFFHFITSVTVNISSSILSLSRSLENVLKTFSLFENRETEANMFQLGN